MDNLYVPYVHTVNECDILRFYSAKYKSIMSAIVLNELILNLSLELGRGENDCTWFGNVL